MGTALAVKLKFNDYTTTQNRNARPVPIKSVDRSQISISSITLI